MTKRKDQLDVVTYQMTDGGEPQPAGIMRTEYLGDGAELHYFTPAITSKAYNNLYGRVMTLLEATTDKEKLKVVKTLFQRELNDYFDNLEKSVKELANEDHIDGHGYYYKNVYVYGGGAHGGRIIRGDDSEIELVI